MILGADVVGVLSPISLADNFSNKWKQVKCYLISFKYGWIHKRLVRPSQAAALPQRNVFAVTPGEVLEMC